MIISHKHKFIFIKTKKTAGTSIEIALSKICGNHDVITVINEEDEIIRLKYAGRKAQNIHIPFSKYKLKDWLRLLKNRKRLIYYNHIPATELKKYLSCNIWNNYYKFCFDRNPVNKCISHYKWRGEKVEVLDFESYLNSNLVNRIKGDHFYKDKNGNYLVDKVYKMEDMKSAFEDLSDKLNVSKESLVAPNFKTKISENNTKLSPEKIKKEYGALIKNIFRTEYKDLYTNE